jgi:hypothetical protein
MPEMRPSCRVQRKRPSDPHDGGRLGAAVVLTCMGCRDALVVVEQMASAANWAGDRTAPDRHLDKRSLMRN